MSVVRGLCGAILGFAVAAGLIAFSEWAAIHAFGAQSVDSGYMLASLAWTVVAAAAGGFIAAWIAGTREMPWSAAVGFLLVVLSLIAMRQHGASQPGWQVTAVAGCGPIAAIVGGAIRLLTKQRMARTALTPQAGER